MSVFYTAFATDGRVLKSGKAPSEAAARLQGEHVIVGVQGHDVTQYVIDGALADRPAIPDFNSVPAGTRVFVDDADHGLCNDGVVEIATDIPGTYRVRLEPPFPHQTLETDVVIR